GGDQAYSSFQPSGGVSLSATATTSRAALGSSAAVAWVCNEDATNIVHVKLGDNTVTATVTDFPLLPKTCGALYAVGAVDIAAITDTSTATVFAATGVGHP